MQKVDIVISNNALRLCSERARKHDIEAVCIATERLSDREAFHKALLAKLQEKEVDLIVLAGYLVANPSDDGGSVSQQDHQYPSISDPVFLRKRFLWT